MKKHLFAMLPFGLCWFCAGLVLTGTLAFAVREDPPACVISLDRMNEFYIGVDNPVSILVRGIPEEQVVVQAQDAVIKKIEGRRYNVWVSTPGQARIVITGKDVIHQTYNFKVKRIPDPGLLLGGRYRSGNIRNGEFKVQTGLSVSFEQFEYDTTCEVTGFELTRMGKKEDPVTLVNKGGRFQSDVRELISRAKPGDSYFFEDIRVKCPGDEASRVVHSLVFKIM